MKREPDGTTRALAGAAVAGFALCGALGAAVSSRTPTRLDVEAIALGGQATPVAVVFTRLGYWPALTTVGATASALAWFAGGERTALPALVASHVVSQTALASAKLLFRRPRPDHWLIKLEADTSYPSGHSASAVTMYAMLAIELAHRPMPLAARAGAYAVLGTCAVGVPWSRLALGAHYATDVIGGVVFGSAWLCGSYALLRIARSR